MPNGTVLIAGGDGASNVLETTERISASADTGQAETSLVAPRAGHAAALLPGRAVLLTGGRDATAELGTAEIWTHATGAVIAAPLNEERRAHTATTLLDGRVLILGGRNANGESLNTGILIDPRPDPFTDGTYDATAATITNVGTVLQVPRAGHTATLLPDGRILVVGGRNGTTDLSSMEILDPASQTSALLPVTLATARRNHTATLRSNGSILIIGGRSGGNLLSSMEYIQPSLDTVAAAGSINLPRAGHTATMIRDGEILVAGGTTASGPTANTELAGPSLDDSTAPAVVSTTPMAGATDVERGVIVALRLSEPLDPATVNTQSIELRNSAGAAIATTVGISDQGLLIAIKPDALLSADTYSVSLVGVTDRAGLPLTPYSFSFTTVSTPVITAVIPSEGSAGSEVLIAGTGFGAAAEDHRLTFGSTEIGLTVVDEDTLGFVVPSMPPGAYAVSLRTKGGFTTAPAAFTIINPTPSLTSIAPSTVDAGSAPVELTLTGSDFVNGTTVFVESTTLTSVFVSANTLTVEIPASLIAVPNTLQVYVRNPGPGGGSSNELPLIVQSAGPAVISVSIFPRGQNLSVGAAQTFAAEAHYSDGTRVNVTNSAGWASSNPETMSVTAAGVGTAAAVGTASITVSFAGHSAAADVVVYAGEAMPTDPANVATALKPTESTPLLESTRFLYEGENPIQRGVAPGAMEATRAAVVRGRLLNRDNQPVEGARVSIADQPSMGYTLSRSDGGYDLVINGGGSLVIEYTKSGSLPVERRVVVAPGDMLVVDDVVLISLDHSVTEIFLPGSGGPQLARGSVVTDQSGTRRATLLFPEEATASMTLPDGTLQQLSTLHVRATEYTLGASGPAAMPGVLPNTSAYTYAVELSVDEAIAAAATTVTFSVPVPVYVENFLNFPVGVAVPCGTYDRQRGVWEACDDGVVLELLAIDGSGRAELDIDGDGNADDATALSVIGITDQERTVLAAQYAAGQSLWRVPVHHFSAQDFNWGASLAGDARTNPSLDKPEGDGTSRTPSQTCGSIIECQDQVLGESVPVSGTAFTLNYRSDRVPGRSKNWLRIPLTEATVPASMQSIGLDVRVGGRSFKQDFPAIAGQIAEFEWDGLDAYGRRVEGATPVEVRIVHRYNWFYAPGWLAPGTRTFALDGFFQFNGPPEQLRPGGRTPAIVEASSWQSTLLPPPRSSASIGGWSFDVHHVYEPRSGTIFFGDGSKRVTGLAVTGPPVTVVEDLAPFQYLDAVVAEDAVYYKTDYGYGSETLYRKVAGEAPVAIGTVQARRFSVDRRNGTVYYAHCPGGGELKIYRIPVGGSALLHASMVLPPADSCDDWVSDVEVAPDGTLWAASAHSIFQMSPGTALTLRAVDMGKDHAELAVGANGTVYRAGFDLVGRGFVIDRLEPTGGLTRIAGDGLGREYGGDGGPAVAAKIGVIDDLAIATDGSVLFADFDGDARVERVRRVAPDGIITTIAGASPTGIEPLSNGAAATGIAFVNTIDVGPDGWIYLFADYNYKIPPTLVSTPARVISDDGLEYYEFNAAGRHLRTTHALTGAPLYLFDYDADGNLVTVTDADGLVTTIARTAQGLPTSIEAPFGQTTTVRQDANGWLSQLAAPGDRVTTFTTSPSGLLTGMVDANNSPWTFNYDARGRLTYDLGPAGASETLTRSALSNGWTLTRSSAMDRQRTYRTELLENGAQHLRTTEADGTVSEHTAFEDGRRESVAADGTTTTIAVTPDPEGGFGRPLPAEMEIATPAGLTMRVLTERYKLFSTPEDFSTVESWDYQTVNGLTSETYYNGATRTFTTTSAAGRITTVEIDERGRPVRTQVGTLTPVTFTYDAQGRLATTAQGPRQSTIAYDTSGRVSTLTDALTRTVTFGYDVADRVTTQTLPDTRTIGFAYDANSNVTSLAPPGRPAHTFTYTPINFTSSYTPPAVPGTGSTGYLFNVDRQPTEVQRPDGQTTVFTYGATNGRLTSVTFSRGQLTYGYDNAGRVSTLTDPGGVGLAFTYDGALPLTETWSGPVEGVVSRTFTNHFELATESVNGTATVAFGYDDDRLLTSAGALSITRDPQNGFVTETTLGTTTDTYDYNDLGEPERQTSVAGATQVFDGQISRDDLGRITQRIEVVDGITRLFQYGYDLAGRLQTVTRDGTLVARYTYDANGNRLTAEGEAYGGGLPITATYDDQDRLLTYGNSTYTYTPNGELATKTVNGQTTSYVYDTLGNLISVTQPNGDVISYTIDGRGRRVGKSINGVRVKGWLYADQLRPIAELDGDGNVVSRFVYGTKLNVPEYMIRDGVTYRIFSDHLGSPRVVVNAATGQIVQRMDFHAFGEIIQDSNPGWQPFSFAGGLYDGDIGLLRFGARDYDASRGRWTAKDPILFKGGDPNVFAYTFEDPVNFIDPSGHGVPAIGALAGGVVGAITGASGAYLQGASTGNVSVGRIAAAGALGFVAGALTGAQTASSLALGLTAGLADIVGQLVGSIGCGININPASTAAAVASGIGAGALSKLLSETAGFAAQNRVVQELIKALPGLGTGMWPIAASGIQPGGTQ